MRILYIDTTTSYLYAAVSEAENILSEVKEDFGKDLSAGALKEISNLLDKNNLTPNDIDKIIVVNGPGSFTGIRVGITIAKTYAYSLKKEISTITSLEAMALSSKMDTAFKVPVIDARRGYVYAGVYTKDGSEVLKAQYISLEALKIAVEHLIGTYSYITNNNLDLENKEGYNPDIKKIINTYMNKETINPHAVNPIYLKLTEAEEKQNIEVI